MLSPVVFTIAPSAPRNVKIQEKSATSLLVTWKPPEYPNGIIQQYRILYSDNSGKNYSTSGITKGLQNETLFYLLSGLKEDTEYKIYVSSLSFNNYLSTCTCISIVQEAHMLHCFFLHVSVELFTTQNMGRNESSG